MLWLTYKGHSLQKQIPLTIMEAEEKNRINKSGTENNKPLTSNVEEK
jgi:hypothetical protein